MKAIRKLTAFLRRDMLLMASYRFAFVLQLLGMFFTILCYYFLARLVDGAGGGKLLHGLDNGYFPFVMVGFALYEFQSFCLSSFQSRTRDAQMMGTLEALLMTPTDIPTILLGSVLSDLLMTIVRFCLYLGIAWGFFGLDLGRANIPGAALVLFLLLLTLGSLGLLGAAFIMVFKKGSPVIWLINSLTILLGGVYYPVGILPAWLQKIAAFIPMTHALEAVRRALLTGTPLAGLRREIHGLSCCFAVLAPLSAFVMMKAVRRAKEDGTLTHF